MPEVFIVMSKRKGFFSSLIKWQTRGPYSHAYIVIRGMAYEADWRGVRKYRFNTLRKHEEAWSVPLFVASRITRARMFAEAQVGKKYDFSSVLRFVSRRQASRKSAGVWFCSELVFAIFKHAGLLLLRAEPWEVSPNLLTRSTLITRHE